MKTKAALSKCPSYQEEEVDKAVTALFAYFGTIEKFVKPQQKVLLKPNFLLAEKPEKGSITHPIVIKSVAKLVKKAGGIPFIGDSSAFNSAKAVAEVSGLKKIAEEMNITIVNLNQRAVAALQEGDKKYKYIISKFALETDVIINLPKLKAHCQVRYTGALKNMYGCVPGKIKALRHILCGSNVDNFAQMIIRNHRIVRPDFTIIDGIESMERTGPRGGDLRKSSLLVAGVDCTALDTLVCNLFNLPPEKVPVLSAAKAMGEGEINLQNIEVVGNTLPECRINDFIWPEKLTPIGFSIPRVIKSVLKNFYFLSREKLQKISK